MDFIGSAIAAKEKFKPDYQFIQARKGNHALKVVPDKNNNFEFMLISVWSEGPVLTSYEYFKDYTLNSVQQYNYPVEVLINGIQKKRNNE